MMNPRPLSSQFHFALYMPMPLGVVHVIGCHARGVALEQKTTSSVVSLENV
jgi:hypothetical protein